MWLRLNPDRKIGKGAMRVRNSLTREELPGEAYSIGAAKQMAESLARASGADIEVLASDSDGVFVTAVATSPTSGSFKPDAASSLELREAYAQSIEMSTSVKTQLLKQIDPDAIRGIAMALVSFKTFASQFKDLTKEASAPGVSYSALAQVYCGLSSHERYTFPEMMPTEIANLTSTWRNAKDPNWAAVSDLVGLGDPKGNRINPNINVEQCALTLDGKETMLRVFPLTVGRLPSGSNFAVVVEAQPEGHTWEKRPSRLVVLASPADLEEAVTAVGKQILQHDIHRNRIVLFREGRIIGINTKLSNTSWSSIVPTPRLKEALDQIEACITNWSRLNAKGLGVKEGLLISGPPGIGKSVSLRAFLNSVVGKATICYVEVTGDLRGVYAFAEARGPAVVVLEDIDALAQDRNKEHRYGNTVHPDLLTVLSGVSQTANVVTIATTNHPEQLDAAISKRPGRFDNHVKVPDLTAEAKIAILHHYLGVFNVPANIWGATRDIFEPLGKAASVGAHIERFVEGAAKRAAVENRGITVFDFKPQVEALLSVAAK